jgi:hypothetical protein
MAVYFLNHHTGTKFACNWYFIGVAILEDCNITYSPYRFLKLNLKPITEITSHITMDGYILKIKLRDNGGRRSGIERRQFAYTLHLPERRSGNDRRAGTDRRKLPRLYSRLEIDL